MPAQREWRFELRITDPELLRKFMEHQRLTTRSLGLRVGCSHATIGHLLTGVRKGVQKEETARRIEEVLGAPRGILFAPKVSRISQDAA